MSNPPNRLLGGTPSGAARGSSSPARASAAAFIALALGMVLPDAALAVANQLSGTLFRDYDNNGMMGTFEPGLGGMVVKAYDASGNVASTTSAADGSFTINAASGSPSALSGTLRFEYTRPTDGSLDFIYPSNRASTIRFTDISPGYTGINLGFSNPSEYATGTPWMTIPAYYNGLAAGNSGRAGIYGLAYGSNSLTPTKLTLATTAQVGTTWGVAYQRSKNRVFASSVLRRHAGYSQGPGYVHVMNWTGSAGSYAGSFNLQGVTPANGGVAINLGSVCRRDAFSGGGTTCGNATDNTLGANGSPNIDIDAYAKVGQTSFGDADMGEDGKTLWLVNLHQRALITVDVSGGFTNGVVPGTVKQYPIASIPGLPACVNGVARPWGLGFHDGKGYLGVVCSEENSGSATATANLRAYVLTFNPSNPTAGFSTALNFPLNYARPANAALYGPANWHPWRSTWPGVSPYYPIPIVSDIEFAEDGDIRIGMLDRHGLGVGYRNRPPVSGTTVIADIRAQGEVLHACKQASGAFAIEGTSGCPTHFNSGLGTQGTGYYYNLKIGDTAITGQLGGLAWYPGKNSLVYTTVDSYPENVPGCTPGNCGDTIVNEVGVDMWTTSTGAHAAGAILTPYNNTITGGFGKGVGLGDIEMMFGAAPLMIGNRVWNDTDGNGIQDPDEPGLPGVTVILRNAAGITLDIAVTDAGGSYYFSNGAGTSTASSRYGVSDLTTDTTGFKVFILTNDAALGGRVPTLANNDPTANGDERDSDGILMNGNQVTINFNTGSAGQNNYSYDFGFTSTTYSLGNRVWLDNGAGGGTVNDGIQNGGEAGIAGVKVKLYAADGSGNPTGAALATQTTDANGWYRFDNLPAGSYVPVVDVAGTGAPLTGLMSSTGATADVTLGGDVQDHGQDTPLGAGSVLPGGIVGAPVTLGAGLQPSGEAVSGTGQGGHGLSDASDNLTDDFGFVPASSLVAIGNRVWLDNGVGGGTANDGIQNGTEAGVSGVAIELYDASNNLVDTTTTNASGYYYFDQLASGQYYVKIPASEFGAGKPLAGLANSTGADSTTTVDRNDNGIDDASPATNGIRSNIFTLAVGTMPVGEDQTGYPGVLPDANVNATNDFGFYAPHAAGTPELKIVKIISNSQPVLGKPFTYTLQVTNQPGSAATVDPVQMIDTPPTGVTLTAVNPPAGWTCVTTPDGSSLSLPLIGNGSRTVTCDRAGSMAAGLTETFTLTAKATQSAVAPATGLINHATITGDGDTPDPNKPDGSYESNHDKAPVNPTSPRIGLLKTVSLTDETGSADGQAQAGEKLTYTFTITNKGNVDLFPVSLTDPQLDAGTLSCDATTSEGNSFSLSGPTAKLRPAESVECTGKHTLTGAEAAAGHVANTANTSGKAPDGTPVKATSTAVWDNTPPVGQTLKGRVSLVKTAAHNDGDNDGEFDAGETISYGFVVRNMGTTALTDIAVNDPMLAGVGSTISCGATSLAVGASTTCTVSPAYVLTTQDVSNGVVTNTATVDAKDPANNPVTDTDTHQIFSGEPVSLELEKTAELVPGLKVGDTITYTLLATNNGGTAINSVTITDNLGVITSCVPVQGSNLGVGQQMACTATHTIQAGESSPISNLGVASGTADGRDSPTEATAHHLVPHLGPFDAQTYRVGDTVFWDVNNDGLMNAGEAGIKGVEVQLQRWNGSNWVPARLADNTVMPNQVTDGNGYYLFQNVPLNPNGQPYRVVVLPANFGNTGSLLGSLSSSPDSTDFTDGGNDRDHGIGTQPQSYGIVSPSFDLNALPNGVYDQPNVDFGFVKKSTATAPDLSFTSSMSAPTVAPGGSVNLTLSASNLLAAGNLTRAPAMSETLPAGLTVATGVGSSFVQGNWKCSVNGARSTLACSYTGSLPLPGGASLGAVTVPVTAAAGLSSGTVLTANGGISKLAGEPNYANNLHSVAVTVQ